MDFGVNKISYETIISLNQRSEKVNKIIKMVTTVVTTVIRFGLI